MSLAPTIGRAGTASPARRPPVRGARAGGALPALIVVAALMLLPVAALVWLAAFGAGEGLAGIASTRPGRATLNTAILLAGVGGLTALVGAGTAWLVTFHAFPGRRALSWLLVLPLAVPTYLAAYAHAEFLSFTGPPQTALRALTGAASPRDYWFPDVRSLGGAIFVLSTVLYPYVYLTTRAMLAVQGPRMAEACRMLGAGPARAARRVVLPLARPAIAVGVLLALMEALNDFGAVQHLGVRTLTRSVFSLWLNRGDLSGAAELALILLGVVLLLIVAERVARGRSRFAERDARHAPCAPPALAGWRRWGATALCTLPILAGFGVPAVVFARFALNRLPLALDGRLHEAALTSLVIGALAAMLTVALALVAVLAARGRGPRSNVLLRLSAIGYAVPGTVVALGLFLALAGFDNWLDARMRAWFGLSTGLLLSGSALIIVYAHAVRFMAMAEGSLSAGVARLSTNLEPAARVLGRDEAGALREVTLPLLKPAIGAAALLVFIDSVKELSATILVRPIGVNTLPTYAYELASQGRPEAAAWAALLIVVLGMAPVAIVSRATLRAER